ncbi:alpha-2-macroglobulin family protein [Cystobacter fuscus]
MVFPDNLTTWRATARVITADTSVGFGVGKARVHQDFLVRRPPRASSASATRCNSAFCWRTPPARRARPR